MRTQQDLSIDEIAADLHISRSVVKKQLYTSFSLVREYIHKRTQLSSVVLIMAELFIP
jgi:RNA polymerase sigma-70 factor (ECF subfamily)